MTRLSKRVSTLSTLALILSAGLTAVAEEAETKTELQSAIEASKAIFAARLAYETVDQTGFSETADALTYRFRAGFQTGEAYDTSFLIEFDHVEDIIDDFNSTINGKTGFPVVADPNVTELNRLQLTNKSIPKTTTTLGRQRIILDDSRFVGNVGWRQNEQTFDAVRFQNTAIGDLNVDVTYLNQINRIFGDDSAVGVWEGDTYLINASHPTPIGKLTGFAYLIDVENAGGVFSSDTFGGRLAGAKEIGPGKLAYALSYATQSDGGSSTLDYSADYYLAEGTYSANGFSAGVGIEVLGGDDQRGFQTPLATLHKFQGWADKFLATPAAGVEDIYAKAGYAPGNVGPFKGLKFQAVYHDFSADVGGADYGSELDLLVGAKWKKLGLTLKYADYQSDGFATDTQKLWLRVDYAF
ncbi:MAG: alginate export family protein [Henriciella sp.]